MPQTDSFRHRKLAAIFFSDIVGYTALMGKDEQRAFELLEKNRQIHKPVIEEFNGRWIKELGDGVLVSFNTVSDAVLAAIKIQKICNQIKEFQLRIGIHQGEVVFEDDDVFGDAVNIAARIQAAADPGSIYISETIHHNIYNKKGLETEFIKVEHLKNVKEPVRIYRVKMEGEPAQSVSLTTNQKKWTTAKINSSLKYAAGALFILLTGYIILLNYPETAFDLEQPIHEKSIAVLPFVDMSSAGDQEYLGDGLAEEIINSITRIKDLKVIGRTSSFQFKNKDLGIQEIGEKLKVSTVLEGSIQKSGNQLRITAQLIRVKDNFHLWSQRFDKELRDIFAIQDSIALNIVEKLKITLSDLERPRLIKKEISQDAYAKYLKALFLYKREVFEESIKYNLEVIREDSTFAPAFAYLSLGKTWILYQKNQYLDLSAINEAKQLAFTSIRLDPELAEGYSALALLAWTLENDFKAAKLNFEKSIQLSPSESLIKNRYGYFLLWMGDFDKATKMAADALKLDPADYNGYFVLANASMYKGKYKEANKFIEEGKKLFPGHKGFERLSEVLTFYQGDYDKILQIFGHSLSSDSTDKKVNLAYLCIACFNYGLNAKCDTLFARLAAMPYYDGWHYDLAKVYASRMNVDACFQELETSSRIREKAFKVFKIDPSFNSIRKDPRYMKLYNEYGFDRYP